MIDIVCDYVSLGVGAAQATTTKAVGIGHSTVSHVGHTAATQWSTVIGSATAVPSAAPRIGAALASVPKDIDQLWHRLGLVRRTELDAVRAQVQRLERRLADPWGDR